MSKELYIAEVERRMTDLDEDYDTASERAHMSYIDRIADQADAMKDRLKELGQWPPQGVK
ncbi:hypothetical protein UFOVP1623_10 [uncultured Caudovirales phage]|uniref:Uncharacterized protein n=1 Tax=uncultured Caudovirales phage TaxID=2100421 RepID=A0A6J5T1R7_9CAUD|nr:hypothetical protein UFOVP1376_53 [uncultured Caudovirales phage]CAB4220647.1 hypothetical protein UFOVP1623_10 [uncultured Caudovirales phage]